MNKMTVNRRKFIKTTSLSALGTMVIGGGFVSVLEEQGRIDLVIMPNDSIANSVPSNWAVSELKTALKKQGAKVNVLTNIDEASGFCVLVSGMDNPFTKNVLSKQNIEAPTQAESLCIVQIEKDNKQILLIAGKDEQGLVYALTELADRVNCYKTNEVALDFTQAVSEYPASKTRSVLRGFSSELEDKPWFYDKEYWISYLDLLAYSRINRLNFSTGMAYNSVRRITDGYMVFPYPLFYVAHAVSANCTIYLPEIYQNSFMTGERDWPYDTQPPKTFGTISPIDPQLFLSPNECAETMIKQVKTGKYTPVEVASWLEDLAQSASESVLKAKQILAGNSVKSNFRRVEEDVLILIGMARFFAAKLRSGVLWQIYILSGELEAAKKAIELYENGRNIWAKMAERATTVYKKNINYGPRGHWFDRISSFDEDIAEMKAFLKNGINPLQEVESSIVDSAIAKATSNPVRPVVQLIHQPVTGFHPGKSLSISLNMLGESVKVMLYYRHVNQSERWQSKELKRNGSTYKGQIPADFTAHRFPIQYYFEVEINSSEATLYPELNTNLANVPYYVSFQN